MMLFQRKVRQSPYLTICVFAFILYWIFRHYFDVEQRLDESQIQYLKLDDESSELIYPYNKDIPLIFIGGVPRSGTTLMRAMLDAHPAVRCGEETRLVPRILSMKHQWTKHKVEAERLRSAGITDDIINSAVRSFILDIIVKHGKPAERLCNKDPLVLRYANYVHDSLFPNSKFIFMIRDGRASVHSIISRNVTITGFDLTSYRDCLRKWNTMIEVMYAQCMRLTTKACLPIYYEQLVLHPEAQMRKILDFLNIEWDDAVLNHEKHIGTEISVSKVEKSTDQIIKPINLDALTSWVGHIPQDVLNEMDSIAPMLRNLGYDPYTSSPNYGVPDAKIQENTNNIKKDNVFWSKLAKKYSIH